jgi:hypothetical protein
MHASATVKHGGQATVAGHSHDPVTSDTRPSVDIAGWVVLKIGSVRLALRQCDVRQVDLVTDLKVSAAGEGPAIGWLIREAGPSWPAYCLDEALAFDQSPPPDRHLCVFFGTEDHVQGILCDHIWSLPADWDLVTEPLPGCLIGPRSPATRLARFGKDVTLVTEGAALSAYLAEIREAGDDRSR